MVSDRLVQTLRTLERQGVRLDNRALKITQDHYRQLDLTQLLALLDAALSLENPTARLGQMAGLMQAFDDLARVLGPPPTGLRELFQEAISLGTRSVGRLLDARSLAAYDLPADREIAYLARSTARFGGYWPNEAATFRADVQRTLIEGLDRGQDPAQVAATLKARTGVSRSRAALIVRNEVGNAQAAAMEGDQTAMGYARYTWSTARDSRVRPSHAAREGKVFSWDRPPPDGPPGAAILCRCVAIPTDAPLSA